MVEKVIRKINRLFDRDHILEEFVYNTVIQKIVDNYPTNIPDALTLLRNLEPIIYPEMKAIDRERQLILIIEKEFGGNINKRGMWGYSGLLNGITLALTSERINRSLDIERDIERVLFHEFGHFLADLEDYKPDNHDSKCYMQWLPFNSTGYCDLCAKRIKEK